MRAVRLNSSLFEAANCRVDEEQASGTDLSPFESNLRWMDHSANYVSLASKFGGVAP